MSSQLKLGFLALISSAAAAPHYSHGKFHRQPSGASDHVYPTGGWPGVQNSTALPIGTGPIAGYPGEQTTTTVQTALSTETLVSTIYASKSGEVVENLSTGAASACGQTIYVTATDKVTVTVPAGGVPVKSSAAPSSVAEAEETPIPEETPEPNPEDMYSILPVHSEQPAETPAPQPTPTPKPALESPAAPVPSAAPVETPSAEPVPEPVPASSAAPVETPSPEPEPIPEPEPTPEAPASSATPTPSEAAPSSTPEPSSPPSSPGYSGTKRGLAYNDAKLCSAFSGGNFGFGYNWGSKRETELPEGLNYIPMMHRPEVKTVDEWLADVKLAVSQGSTAVMGFNEPDHANQAAMSPDVACKEWVKYMNPIASAHPEVTIIGPSVTNGPAPMGLDWLTRFHKECPDAIVHADNMHFYSVYDGAAERFKSQVEKCSQISNKPVWVTEFGLDPGAASPEQAATFLKDVTEFMDGSDAVQGYAYFMVGTGENQLSGSGPVSEAYASA